MSYSSTLPKGQAELSFPFLILFSLVLFVSSNWSSLGARDWMDSCSSLFSHSLVDPCILPPPCSYRPTLSLSYVAEILGFYSTTECSDFLVKEMSIPSSLVEGVEKLDCKEIWSQICQAGATEASAT
uniref:Uncharacterized protein n=1 Tax=Schistocephalus solidus TaxID=70667 RepID=A0A0X3P9M3_SCHSO